jgi:hypothetical protein
MQYRAGGAGRVEFAYPSSLRHPKGDFRYSSYNGRFARVAFEASGYTYEIEEQLVGPTSVRVVKHQKLVSSFECSRASRTLLDTAVIDLFAMAGVPSP